MHVGWTRDGIGVLRGTDGSVDIPTSVRGELMSYDEVQLAGDGELITRSPYLAYKPEDTRVFSYTITHGSDAVVVRPGFIPAPTAKMARDACHAVCGDILEERAAGDNLFLRVRKPGKERK